METYLTVEELAAYFKFSVQTIRRWILNREVPYHKIHNSIRFRLSEIESWVENNDVLKKTNEKKEQEADLFGEDKGGEA